jgi:hypothetical protein
MRVPQLLLLGALTACSDAVGPDLAEGTLLAAGSLALDWSADGREIFYYDSGYSKTGLQPVPDRILAVNVTTRATRVVVASGAYGAGGARRPGAVPPRATTHGLAYTHYDSLGFTLHLVTAYDDIPVAASGGWFTTTPDRTRLLYNFPDRNVWNDSIGLIDLATDVRTVYRTGPYGPTVGPVVSPDGNKMLVERVDSTAGFAILSLQDGTITALDGSALFPDGRAWSPVPLGWNANGLWFILYGGPPHLVRYSPPSVTGEVFVVPDVQGGTRVTTGGTALPSGDVVVWMTGCNYTDPLNALCNTAAYVAWRMNPFTGLDEQLTSVNTSPAYDYPRAFFAAASPDGRSLAYVLGNELRVLPLH